MANLISTTQSRRVYLRPGRRPANAVRRGELSGLFRSDDGGGTWALATESLGLSEAVPSTVPGTFARIRQRRAVFGGMAGGILRSVDGGPTWTLANSPRAAAHRHRAGDLAQLHRGRHSAGRARWKTASCAPRTAAAAGRPGILACWISPSSAWPSRRISARTRRIFAGTETGIFRSTNGGRAWREVDLPIGFETVLSLAVSPAFKQDGTLFAGTESKGLLRSADGGASWLPVGEDIFDGPINGVLLASPRGWAAWMPRFCATVRSGSRATAGQAGRPSWPELSEQGEITALLAPQGLAPGSPVWAGLVGGRVEKGNL